MDCATSVPTHPAYTNPTTTGPPGGWTFRKGLLAKIVYNEFCGIGGLPVGGSKCFQSKVGFEFANPVFPFWICLFGPFVGRIDAALNARTWNAKIAGCVYVFHGFIEKPYFLVC